MWPHREAASSQRRARLSSPYPFAFGESGVTVGDGVSFSTRRA